MFLMFLMCTHEVQLDTVVRSSTTKVPLYMYNMYNMLKVFVVGGAMIPKLFGVAYWLWAM